MLAHVTLEAYGLWSAAFIMVSYVGLSTMGISTVYIKFVAEYCARRDYLKANQLLSTGLCLTIPFCATVFAIFYFLWPRIVVWLHIAPALRNDAHEVVLSVVAIFLASLSLGAFHDAVGRGAEDGHGAAALDGVLRRRDHPYFCSGWNGSRDTRAIRGFPGEDASRREPLPHYGYAPAALVAAYLHGW